jgi:hypothetical protein
MFLKLAIEGKVIASAPLDAKEAGNLEYLFTKRSMLAEACCDTIALHEKTPVYFIEVASRMNRFPSSRKRA